MTQTTANVAINGDELRRRRQLAGETQDSFAALADISPAYVSHIEAGRRQTVSPPAFVRICNALGIATDDRELLVRKQAAA